MSALVTPTPIAPMAPPVSPLTAEEFMRMHGHLRVEVIDGHVREKPMPPPSHGRICFLIARAIDQAAEANDLGRVVTNDSFVRVAESPLKVLAPDVGFYSYERLPRGPIPDGLLYVMPDLVVEVRSPSNTSTDIFGKIGDYLRVGIRAIIVLDAASRTASVYRPEVVQQIFNADQDLAVPEVLPGFTVCVGRLFDA